MGIIRRGAIAAIALVALLATACSSTGTGTSSASVGYGKDQPKVKVAFWYMPNGSAPNDYFKAEAAAFNAAHPNIEVDGTLVDWGDAFTKITAALTSGVGPDVTQLGTTWVGAFSRSGGTFAAKADGGGGSSVCLRCNTSMPPPNGSRPASAW